MKNYFLLIAILVAMATKAQVTKVYLQASGLTCSMCGNSIFKALKTLDFIDNVDADVKTYTFEISFKSNSHVDFDKIRNKVEGAGFSVSGFIATINFDNIQVKESEPVTIGNYRFVFVNLREQSLNGAKQVKLLDKGFISSKEYKSNDISKSLTDNGVYHVTL